MCGLRAMWKAGRIGARAPRPPGGPGAGTLDLKILGFDFAGMVEHGQITIGP